MTNRVINDLLILDSGVSTLGGCDEVGIGSWAGPVTAACAVVTKETLMAHRELFEQVNDSKRLTPQRRYALSILLMEHLDDFAIVSISQEVIDTINVKQASLKAMRIAIQECDVRPSMVLIDGDEKCATKVCPERTVIKGDTLHCCIAAASILAKTVRDTFMARMSHEYPGYDFENNVGYGTPAHQEGLAKLGLCDLHRRSVKPIKEILRSQYSK